MKANQDTETSRLRRGSCSCYSQIVIPQSGLSTANPRVNLRRSRRPLHIRFHHN